MKKNNFILLISLFSSFSYCFAQQSDNAAGGTASGAGGTATYSVGQVVYTSNYGSNGSVLQGVQQPYEISITTGMEHTEINLNLSVYPNPAVNYLTLTFDTFDNNTFYQLLDMNGKLIEKKTIASTSTSINVENLDKAIYFLKIYSNNQELKTFKIIKN